MALNVCFIWCCCVSHMPGITWFCFLLNNRIKQFYMILLLPHMYIGISYYSFSKLGHDINDSFPFIHAKFEHELLKSKRTLYIVSHVIPNCLLGFS